MSYALFHGCPECPSSKGPDDIYTAGKGERAVCYAHETTWFLGSNLTSQWRCELEEAGGDVDRMHATQRERYREIEGYTDVSLAPGTGEA